MFGINKIKQLFKKQEEVKIPYESEDDIVLRMQFYSSLIKKDGLFFDVGANIGNRITPVLKIGARVVAIEPQEYCQKILLKKFGSSITLVKEGLGDKEETREFFISDATTISSFSKEWIDAVKQDRFKEHNWNTSQKIKMTTLEHLIAKFGVPDLIKIDVEGFELEVLKGLKSVVPCISYEYTTPEQTDKALECLDYLAQISPRIECNYSVGESMKLQMDNWLSYQDMKNLIASNEFVNTGFGDIYIKSYSS